MKRFWIISLVLLPFLGAMDIQETRHLLARTQFGMTTDQLRQMNTMSRLEAIDYLLSKTRTASTLAPLNWMTELSIQPPKPRGEMTLEEIRAFQALRRSQVRELKSWWMAEMTTTPTQLTEFMVLFWHNHFVSEAQKVQVPHLLYRQNILFRKYALGNFKELLHAVAKDPAMIVYLDNVTNVKDHPNENFARELMELFTLGEGNYTETDVKEAARAFTGWSVNRDDGAYFFNARQHDNGVKTFLGEEGNFNGDDIIDILLNQDRTAEFVAEKMWKVFISSEPDPGAIGRLASVFRAYNYELKPLLSALFSSSYFWDEMDQGSLVKSPVEMIVGTWRAFKIPVKNPQIYFSLVRASTLLGQSLLDPPNVKGWEGGTSWITTTTLLNRRTIIKTVFAIDENGTSQQRFPRNLFAMNTDEMMRWLLAVPPAGPLNEDSNRDLVSSIVLDPAYQVK